MKNRYVYVVTRRVTKSAESSGYDVPNLGVHDTVKCAMEHFESIKLDRSRHQGFKCYWDIMKVKANAPYEDYRIDYRRAYLEYKEYDGNNKIEELIIERWNLKK